MEWTFIASKIAGFSLIRLIRFEKCVLIDLNATGTVDNSVYRDEIKISTGIHLG